MLAISSGCAEQTSPEGHNSAQPTGQAGQVGTNAKKEPVALTPRDLPGEPIYDLTQRGAGECRDTTLEQLIQKVVAQQPELADITQLQAPNTGGDGSFVFAYQRADGGFALVWKRGQDDCFAGCIDNEYWYFQTRAGCEPEPVGHYHRDGNGDGKGNCIAVEGTEMWGKPEPLDPMHACGEASAAEPIAGSYHFHAQGKQQPCARSGEQLPERTIDSTISIDVVQDANMPAHGNVTVNGLGHPLIDGRMLAAEFSRKRFAAHVSEQNLPSRCIQTHMLEISFDFEGFGGQQISLDEVDTPDCDHKPDDYCKGNVRVTLTKLD